MKRVPLLFWLILASMLVATNTVAQDLVEYPTYRKTRPTPALRNPVVAKILAPLGVLLSPIPIQPDSSINLNDAKLVLDTGTYPDYVIPARTIVRVKGKVDFTGRYSFGEGVKMIRGADSWVTCKGGVGTLGKFRGDLVQILGDERSMKWEGLYIKDGAQVTVHEVVVAGFSPDEIGVFLAQGQSGQAGNDNRLEGDHLYSTMNYVGLRSFSRGIVGRDNFSHIDLHDSWVVNNDSLDLMLSGMVRGEFTDSNINRVWLFDYEWKIPEGGMRTDPDGLPNSETSLGSKIVFTNTALPAGLVDSLSKRVPSEPQLPNLIQINGLRFGNPTQLWPPSSQNSNEADFNLDGLVDFDDFFAFADNFGKTTSSFVEGRFLDLDASGTVDFGDFFIFADNFGDRRDLAKLMALAEAKLGLPKQVKLLGNYPNPFNPNTTINFSLPGSMMVDVSIYDLTGQSIKTLAASTLPAGSHQLSWDGTDVNGHAVASGTYICILRAGNSTFSKKMLLLR